MRCSRLCGRAVLASPPPTIDLDRIQRGTTRRTDAELRALEEDVLVPPRGDDPYFSGLYPAAPSNRDVLTAAERIQVALARHDVLVFPSYYEGEGVPGVMIEAFQMASALCLWP